MRRFLTLLPVVLLSISCDQDPTTLPPTTPERPARLAYAWASIEGAITVREEPFVGEFTVVCASGTATGTSPAGGYSMLFRLERPVTAGPTEFCHINVGKPIVFTRSIEIPFGQRADAAPQTRFDVVLLPDTPPMVTMATPIVSVAAAGGHTCAVSATGEAYCWGENRFAELGTGFHLQSFYPVRVVTSERFVSVVASGNVRTTYSGPLVESSGSCGQRADGVVFCWGDRMWEAMDTVSEKAARVPQRVKGLSSVSQLSGGRSKVCASTQASELYCWGGYGQPPYSSIQRVNVTDVVDVDNGWHSCAVLRGGAYRCWGGSGEWGVYGDTTGAPAFKQITVGESFTCALDVEGAAWCWGRNHRGQLGRGVFDQNECRDYTGYPTMCPGTDIRPKRVATDVRFSEIDAGQNHACGLATTRAVYCWGSNSDGQLGIGTTSDRSFPSEVAGNTTRHFTKLAVGDLHTCGIQTDGHLYCWGQGKYGQLGSNRADSQLYPQPVWGQ